MKEKPQKYKRKLWNIYRDLCTVSGEGSRIDLALGILQNPTLIMVRRTAVGKTDYGHPL